jgi:hypothetical protein
VGEEVGAAPLKRTYWRVVWIHNDANNPIAIYAELDEQRWEMRKCERFRDGRLGWATATEEHGGTHLAVESWPANAEIVAQTEFQPTEIGEQEFESVWAERGSS